MMFRDMLARRWRGLVAVVFFCAAAAAAAAWPAAGERLAPSLAGVSYGPGERNGLDLWLADTPGPAPLLVFFHGGGFHEGDKGQVHHFVGDVGKVLEQGVSLTSVNYPYVTELPLTEVLANCARAIQFLRSQAEAFHIDPRRVAAFGESAGAGISLWLAFRNDLADPDSPDPVSRESSRLWAAGAIAPQATYDFAKWPRILGIPQMVWHVSNLVVGPMYYHVSPPRSYFGAGAAMRRELDYLTQIDALDPPVYLEARREFWPVRWQPLARWAWKWVLARYTGVQISREPVTRMDILHHARHVSALSEACARQGAPHLVQLRGQEPPAPGGLLGFLLATLKAAPLAPPA